MDEKEKYWRHLQNTPVLPLVNQHLPFKDIVGFSEFVDSHQKASARENYSVKCKIKIVDSAEGGRIHNL